MAVEAKKSHADIVKHEVLFRAFLDAVELEREIRHEPPSECRRAKEEQLLHLAKRLFLGLTGKKAYVSPWRWHPERP